MDASRETRDASLIHRVAPARAGQAPHPALLLLHGRGADELDLLGLGPELDPRFFIVSTRAPYAWMDGYRWYELEGPGRADAASFGHSLEVLHGFVGELTTTYPVDPERLFLLGFSQGAVMANALTLSGPQRVAGAVLLSGFQPNIETFTVNTDGIKGKPFFVAHGTLDPMLGVDLGRATRETLTRLGTDVTYREYDMGHQIIAPELADIDTWLKDHLAR